MNKERRQAIKDLLSTISDTVDELNTIDDTIGSIYLDIEEVKDEEEGAFDNMPDGLQEGARGDAMQAAIDKMDSALTEADAAKTHISSSIDYLAKTSNTLKELLIK